MWWVGPLVEWEEASDVIVEPSDLWEIGGVISVVEKSKRSWSKASGR